MAMHPVARQRAARAALRAPDRQRLQPPTDVLSQPAPIGGINTRDSLDTMAPTDAIRLINWIPDADVVTIRPGQVSHGTGVGAGVVEALAVWKGPASEKLVAAGDGELYDASSAGAASGISVSASYTSDQWQMLNYAGRLWGFNGADAPWDYDGTTLTTTAWTGIADKTKLIQATVLNSFLIIVEDDSASFWYPDSKAVTGTLHEWSLSTIARHGGKLMAVGTWSRDGGDGLDDMLVCVMSTGELLVYEGTDPLSISLVGSYKIAPPIGRRCVQNIGGDLVVLTESGVMPVSLILRGYDVDRIVQESLWGKMHKAFIDAAANYRTNIGWNISEVFSNGRMYFNIPVTANGTSYQFALYAPTGAWGEYRGVDAYSWAEYSGSIYFGGGGGVVYKHTGVTDAGSAIQFNAKGAFTYLGQRGREKYVTALRPLVAVQGTVDCSIEVDRDFSERSFPSNMNTLSAASDGSAWDEDDWDAADWASPTQPILDRVSAGGEGLNFAIRFFGQSSTELKWYSTDYLYQLGALV